MERPKWVVDEKQWRADCARIVDVARKMIRGDVTVTEASRLLSFLRFAVHSENDPDFIRFVAISSETDQFPVGELRERWHPEAVKELDAQRTEIESRLLASAVDSAKRLVAKFDLAR